MSEAWWEQDARVPACPFVARGVVRDKDWLGESAWSQLDSYGKRESTPLTYDIKKQGSVFTYWDNNSLLASHATSAGLQSHERVVTQSRSQVLRDVRAITARFGGTARRFSSALESALMDSVVGGRGLEPTEPGSTKRSLGLWLSAAGTASAPHYDSFHNTHLVLAGPKYLRLWPPAQSKELDVYPATHPCARQARFHDGANAFELVLNSGDVVFVPAGWIHRFAASTHPVAAVSITSLPQEFHHFNAYIRSPQSLPFLHLDSGRWTIGRVAASLLVFATHLALALNATDILLDLSRRVYSNQSRNELGIRDHHDGPCPYTDQPSPADQHAAEAAATLVAREFEDHYRPWLRRLYLGPYFETVLSKLASFRQTGFSPNDAIAVALNFIDACVIPELELRGQHGVMSPLIHQL